MNAIQRQRILDTAIVRRNYETLEETASRLKSLGIDTFDVKKENEYYNGVRCEYYKGYEDGAREMLRVFGYKIRSNQLVKL